MNRLLFLVGCTASGKKQLARELCATLPLEPLSLDSMKVFRGMDVGTDKAPFALTNLVEPSSDFSVGEYCEAAREAVASIRSRGRVPIFVGGTGLYLRALVRGLFRGPAVSPVTRRRVLERLEQLGEEAGHRALQRVDPAAAARIHPHDRKRVSRALEVFESTGVPLSHWQREHTERPIAGPATLIGLRWPSVELRRRIELRVDRMWERGLLNEVRALWSAGRLGPIASEAIGYREVIDLLEGRLEDEDACREQIRRNTWRFSRRQANWFRQFPDIEWIDGTLTPDGQRAAALEAIGPLPPASHRAAAEGSDPNLAPPGETPGAERAEAGGEPPACGRDEV